MKLLVERIFWWMVLFTPFTISASAESKMSMHAAQEEKWSDVPTYSNGLTAPHHASSHCHFLWLLFYCITFKARSPFNYLKEKQNETLHFLNGIFLCYDAVWASCSNLGLNYLPWLRWLKPGTFPLPWACKHFTISPTKTSTTVYEQPHVCLFIRTPVRHSRVSFLNHVTLELKRCWCSEW